MSNQRIPQLGLAGLVLLLPWLFLNSATAKEFDLSGPEDKLTLMFKPTSAGKVVLSGRWEGKAKSLEVALYSPTQWLAHWRGNIVNKSFEMSWDFSDKDVEESVREWKIVLRAKGGDAKGEANVAGTAVGDEAPASEDKPSKSPDASPKSSTKSSAMEDMGLRLPKDDAPPIPLDEFGVRVRRTFLEAPFYKPWVDKITSGKKTAKVELRPLGLTVTPAIRKIQSRYGDLSLTVRNITLTPAQNVHLMESITGSVETRIEILMRVEVPGWHVLALQLSPYAAYPGEPPRLTAMQVDVRSLSRGEVIPSSSYPFASGETLLLVPILLSQPGEYLFSGQPIAKEPSEILFVLGSIELFRLTS